MRCARGLPASHNTHRNKALVKQREETYRGSNRAGSMHSWLTWGHRKRERERERERERGRERERERERERKERARETSGHREEPLPKRAVFPPPFFSFPNLESCVGLIQQFTHRRCAATA